jgi:hypothetical protein
VYAPQDRWWTLPGPRETILQVAHALRNGASVVLGSPAWHVGGARGALTRELAADRKVVSLPRRNRGDMPVDRLRRYLQLPASVTTAADFVRAEGREPWVVHVACDEPQDARAWFGFLEAFAQSSRDEDAFDRTVFLVELEASTCDMPSDDTLVRAVRLDEHVERIDVVLFALHAIEGATNTPLERQLRASLVAELARFDAALASELSTFGLARLLSLGHEFIDAFARKRNWSVETPLGWHAGTCATIDGREMKHLFLPSPGDDGDSIKMAVWRAQVSVLFPLLERRRVELLRDYGGLIALPYRKPIGDKEVLVENRFDLELGDLAHALRTRVPKPLSKELRALADARNDLAHFRPVGVEVIEQLTS